MKYPELMALLNSTGHTLRAVSTAKVNRRLYPRPQGLYILEGPRPGEFRTLDDVATHLKETTHANL